jgi:uncharacterized membrane protein YqjE
MADVDTGVGRPATTMGGAGVDAPEPLDANKSLGELVSQLSSDFSNLVSTQLELAKTEIKDDVARAGKGAGMVTGGGFAAYLAILLLSLAAAWGLSEAMPTGLAFLIVAVTWAAVAGVLLLMGRDQLRSVHPVPEQTKQTIKEDVEWAKQQRN